MNRLPLLAIAVLFSGSLACGPSGEISEPGRDAGTAGPDGGPALDGGDAGPGVDAGADGGLAHDGGPQPDSGLADAGPLNDSGAEDGGTPDAGGSDAGDGGLELFDGGCAPESVTTTSCDCPSGIGTRRCFADGTAWGNCSCADYGAQFYVSPAGSDSNAGTLAAPFLTLERAQVAVRSLADAGFPDGGAVVWLRGGVYPRQSTFALTKNDSGGPSSPVVYRGYPGEMARVMGGVQLPASAFQTVVASSSVWSRLDPTAQGVVVAADLTTLGITDFGTPKPRGYGALGTPSALELFIDGIRQPLGRWPDLDSTDPLVTFGFSSIASVTSNTVFTLAENRTTRWTQAPDPWVQGFFAYTWADNSEPVASLDATTGTITLGDAPNYGITNPIQGAGAPPVRAFNLLEEITEPGEWYLDRSSGLLYLWPPANLAQHDLVVSLLSAPLVTVSGASNVTLQEITFEATRTSLLAISGQSSNVQVVGCMLRDSGDGAASVADGTNNVFDGDLIYDTGEGGISVAGGDRPSLTQANNFVKNCDIHDFSQIAWTYTPAVNVSGDGIVVKNNVLHDSPHAAILYGGSQHTLEENEIYGVCSFSSDSGAIYAGRDWGARGNAVQFNFIHDVVSHMKGGYGVHGIYLDDCLSGIAVTGNVIVNVSGYGIQHGGGRDDLMTNNILVGCATGALTADSRCAADPTPVSNVAGDSWNFLQKLEAVNYQQDPWATAFPSCAAIPDDYAVITDAGVPWLIPAGTTFTNNLGFNDAKWINASAATLAAYASTANDIQDQDPLLLNEAFVMAPADVSKTPLALQPGSPVPALQAANPTPFASIGIQP